MTGVQTRLGRRTALGLGATAAFAGPALAQTRALVPVAAAQPAQDPMLLPDTATHLGAVRAVAVSADGALVATGSVDRSVRVWDGATGRLLRRWHPPLGAGLAGSIAALDFAQGGRLLVVTAIDWEAPRGIVYIVDVETGAIRRVIGSRAGSAWQYPAVAVSPRTGLVAVAAERQGVIAFAVGPDLAVRVAHADAAQTDATVAVAFSPDGATLAAVSQQGPLRLLNVSGDRVQAGAAFGRALPGQPFSLAFSADGRRVAIGFANRRGVMVADLATGQTTTLEPPAGLGQGNLAAVAWGADADGTDWLFAGGTLQAQGGGNLVLAWRDGRQGAPLSAEVAQDSIAAMARHPSGGVVFGSSDAAWGKVAPGRGGRRLDTAVTPPERLDFREVLRRRWAVDATGSVVEFQGLQRGQPAVRFDLGSLRLLENEARAPRPDLRRPRAIEPGRLPPLMLQTGDRLQSSDVSPRGDLVLMGSDETLLLLNGSGQEVARRPVGTAAWGVAISGDGRVAVVAHGDGTLRWYALGGEAPLLELGGLFVHAGRQKWVAWRRDGRFAYSELGGETLVGVHQNGVSVPNQPEKLTSAWTTIDQEYRRLYDPEAVRTLLSGEVSAQPRVGFAWWPGRVAEHAEAAATLRVLEICADAVPPEPTRRTRMISALEGEPEAPAASPAPDACHAMRSLVAAAAVTVPDRTQAVRVRLELGPAAGPVTVDAFVNGMNAGRSVHLAGAIAEKTVLLPGGEAQIEFRAYGSGGAFTRTPAVVVQRRATTPAAPAGASLHVLAVGIDHYTGTTGALRYAVSDARTFVDTVTRVLPRAYGAMAPPTLLTDEAAGVDQVREALVKLALQAQPGDAVMIYMSGHGVSVKGDYAFVTANVRDARAAQERGDGCLGANALVSLMSNLRSSRVMLLLDTCFANAIDLQVGGRLGHETGRYVLTASGSDEQALDGYDGANGVFGYAVKEGLTTVSPASGGVLDALELCRFVRDRVQSLAEARRHRQRAHFQAAGDLIAFPVAQAR